MLLELYKYIILVARHVYTYKTVNMYLNVIYQFSITDLFLFFTLLSKKKRIRMTSFEVRSDVT